MNMMNVLSTAATSAVSLVSSNGSNAKGVSSDTRSEDAQPFAALLTDTVSQVNRLENNARAVVDGLMTGAGVDVHEAMIATEKASMAFELALSVRNKAIQAYQSVMGMQF